MKATVRARRAGQGQRGSSPPVLLGARFAAVCGVLCGIPCGVACWGSPATASAQPRPLVSWTAGEPALAGRAELWQRRVERALERAGATVVTDPETWAYAPPGFPRESLEEVDAIETFLFLARSRASELDESGALAALIEAERRGETVISFAGGAAWYAEVEVQIAIAAFQLGERALARAALERAASLDPRRLVRPAEAPPELVELARRAVLSARSAPVSSFTVRALGVRDARVFVDDEAAGSSPVQVEIGAGLHAVRVEASGHRPWASLVHVLPGTRADIEVALSPEPAAQLARELLARVRAMDLAAVPGLLAALAAQGVVLDRLVLTTVGEGPFDRALMLSCDPSACGVAQRLEGDVPARRESLESAPGDDLGGALAWLEEVPRLDDDGTGAPPPGPEWWQEPWPWLVLGGAAVVAGVGVAAGVLAEPPPTRSLIIELPDPTGR